MIAVESGKTCKVWKRILWPVAAILVIAVVLQLIYTRREGGFRELKPVSGVLDIGDLDLREEIVTIANDWDFYPNRLYTSEDFARGVEPPQDILPSQIPYGTHRLLFRGKPNTYYTICGYSVDYGSRIYVDGDEVYTSGVVDSDPEKSVPKTGYLTVPIHTDERGEAEIICQYVNFVHTDGGYIHATYLSVPQNIEDYKTGNAVVSITLGGGLLMLCLYFLLHGAIQRQRSYLSLSFCCLVFSMRDQLFFFISLLPRSLPWVIEYRIYISVVNLLPVSLLLLAGSLYPVGKKWIYRCFYGVSAAFLAAIWLLPTKSLHLVNVVSYICCIPYFLWLMLSIAGYFRRNRRERADYVSMAGFLVLLLALVLEGLMTFHNAAVLRHGFTPTAMLIFIFLIAVSISLRIQARETALAESRSRSRVLQQVNVSNLEFLRKVAHELKTPLTVISGYAQLTQMQLETSRISPETPENLQTIQDEAQRLADLVTVLKDYSCGRQENFTLTRVEVSDLLDRVTAICRPLCMKNNNRVVIECGDCGAVHGSGELMLQIFINLVTNANRHMADGTITVSAAPREEPGFVVFRVADTGSGIDPAVLPHIFENGCSGDGGSGLGLTICRDAVRTQGGTIAVEESRTGRTVFRFTVPREEDD